MATVAVVPKGDLSRAVVGEPPSKPGKAPSNRYLKGETSEVRQLFLTNDWDAGKKKMVTNLVKKFKSTAEYADWWANETVATYQKTGVPPAPTHRSKAVATPLMVKPSNSVTLATIIESVDRAGGDYAKSAGVTRIAFAGNTVFEGVLDDQESLIKLHGIVHGYTSLASTADDFKSKYATAAANLLNFLQAHEKEMTTMGLSAEAYMGDASHAKELAVATKRADDAISAAATKDSTIAKLMDRITELEAELGDEAEEGDDEEEDDEEEDEESDEEEEMVVRKSKKLKH